MYEKEFGNDGYSAYRENGMKRFVDVRRGEMMRKLSKG